MSFLENLERLMSENGIKNINSLSKQSNIPYTTLKNFYTRGTENVGLSTLKKIASFFNVTLDYLIYENITYELDKSEQNIIESFRQLNDIGKEKLITYADDLLSSKKYDKYTNDSNPANDVYDESIEMIKEVKKYDKKIYKTKISN